MQYSKYFEAILKEENYEIKSNKISKLVSNIINNIPKRSHNNLINDASIGKYLIISFAYLQEKV